MGQLRRMEACLLEGSQHEPCMWPLEVPGRIWFVPQGSRSLNHKFNCK